MNFIGLMLALSLQDGGPLAVLESLEKSARTVRTVEAEFELTRVPGISRLCSARRVTKEQNTPRQAALERGSTIRAGRFTQPLAPDSRSL